MIVLIIPFIYFFFDEYETDQEYNEVTKIL